MNNNKDKIEKIADKIAKNIIAMPLVDEYKGVKTCLNGNDHRPPHLITWYINREQKADFAINNGNDQQYRDGELLQENNFPKSKLKDIKEWFSSENREYRIQKLIEYFLERGEPTWFKLNEIFTDDELEKYNRIKQDRIKTGFVNKTKLDINKEWSLENNYDKLMEIKKCIFNDDYTLSLTFADGKKKVFDVKDKIFNKQNREYKWFKKLQDIKKFFKGEFYTWTVAWDDDTDISSYELYMNDK